MDSTLTEPFSAFLGSLHDIGYILKRLAALANGSSLVDRRLRELHACITLRISLPLVSALPAHESIALLSIGFS